MKTPRFFIISALMIFAQTNLSYAHSSNVLKQKFATNNCISITTPRDNLSSAQTTIKYEVEDLLEDKTSTKRFSQFEVAQHQEDNNLPKFLIELLQQTEASSDFEDVKKTKVEFYQLDLNTDFNTQYSAVIFKERPKLKSHKINTIKEEQCDLNSTNTAQKTLNEYFLNKLFYPKV